MFAFSADDSIFIPRVLKGYNGIADVKLSG